MAIDLMSMSEIDRLAHCIAFESTVALIECHSIAEEDEWMNIDPEDQGPDERDALDDATRYLDLCGLLIRHPEKPWVKILDQSEMAFGV